MKILTWDDKWGAWRSRAPHFHNQGQWKPTKAPTYVGQTAYDPFYPKYIAEETIWQRDLSSMPLAWNSSTIAKWMWDNTPATKWNSVAFGTKTSLNVHSFGTAPVASYIIDSTQPNCPKQFIDSCQGAGLTEEQINTYLVGEIPWPSYVAPARNGDKGLCIIDIGTGIWREYFGVQPVKDNPGHWTASSGGFAVYKPGFEGLINSRIYAPQHSAGHATVFGGFDMLGYIGAEEILHGEIRHALAFTIANCARTAIPSWPARMSDGKAPLSEANKSPTHGQWGRLPSSVNPNNNPKTGKEYSPLTKLLINAAKKYGIVATDTNAWCHAFKAWSTPETVIQYGEDPWAQGGMLSKHLKPWDINNALDISDFPWDLTEWAPVDWGRPSPDFNLRPDEHRPWVSSVSADMTVASVLSGVPKFAHRGGSRDYPEMSELAYSKAIEHGWRCLEISLGRTRDGVWFGAHDQFLDRVSLGKPDGQTLKIRDMTWSQVQQYHILGSTCANDPSQPNQPFAKFIDILDKFKNIVWLVDPKTFIWTHEIVELFNILDNYGGPRRFIIKWFGQGTGQQSLIDNANEKGYQSWGFFYGNNVANISQSDIDRFTILGMDHNASEQAWRDFKIKAGDRPVWAHICTTEQQVSNAKDKGAEGFQCSSVKNITP